jgi:hypothetical protein
MHFTAACTQASTRRGAVWNEQVRCIHWDDCGGMSPQSNLMRVGIAADLKGVVLKKPLTRVLRADTTAYVKD